MVVKLFSERNEISVRKVTKQADILNFVVNINLARCLGYIPQPNLNPGKTDCPTQSRSHITKIVMIGVGREPGLTAGDLLAGNKPKTGRVPVRSVGVIGNGGKGSSHCQRTSSDASIEDGDVGTGLAKGENSCKR